MQGKLDQLTKDLLNAQISLSKASIDEENRVSSLKETHESEIEDIQREAEKTITGLDDELKKIKEGAES